MSRAPRILVAGIGNIFLFDDAFGVRVVEVLARRQLADGVRLVDFGIRGLDLAFALMEDWDAAILIDACRNNLAPGTVFVLEPDSPADSQAQPVMMQGHSMDPESVLRLVSAMGGQPRRVLVVGCEPTPIDPEADIQMELSPSVAAAIEPAADLVESVIEKLSSQLSVKEIAHDHACTGSRC